MKTEDEVLRLFEQADPARGERGAPPIDARHYLDALRAREPSADVIVIDLDQAMPEQVKPRRGLVAVAAAAALLLLLGSLLVLSAERNDQPSVPAAPGTSAPLTTVLPPALSRGGPSPSAPEVGELAAVIVFSHHSENAKARRWGDGFLAVYADGRVLSTGLGETGERRLTPDGVERVRQEFLATRVFDGSGPSADDNRVWYSCTCVISVQEGGRLLASDAAGHAQNGEVGLAGPIDPELDGKVGHLIDFVSDLASSLPSSAWADPEVREYVPSKYRLEVWDEGAVNKAVPDVSAVLRLWLPTPLVERIAAQGWVHTPWGESVDISLADARELAEGLANAGLWTVPRSPVPQLRLPLSDTNVMLIPFMPDGALPYSLPG